MLIATIILLKRKITIPGHWNSKGIVPMYEQANASVSWLLSETGVSEPYFTEYENAYNCQTMHFPTFSYTNLSNYLDE